MCHRLTCFILPVVFWKGGTVLLFCGWDNGMRLEVRKKKVHLPLKETCVCVRVGVCVLE